MKAGSANVIEITVFDVMLYDVVTAVSSTTIAVHRQSRLFDATPTEPYGHTVVSRATIVSDHGGRRLLALPQRSKSRPH